MPSVEAIELIDRPERVGHTLVARVVSAIVAMVAMSALVLALSGCGQKGPLFLPPPSSTATTSSATLPPAAPASASSAASTSPSTPRLP